MNDVPLDLLVDLPSCKLYFIPASNTFMVRAHGHLTEGDLHQVLDEMIQQITHKQASSLIVDQGELEHVPGMLRGWFTAQFLTDPEVRGVLRSLGNVVRIHPTRSFASVMMNVVARVTEAVLGVSLAQAETLEEAISLIEAPNSSEHAA
ncbi:MAG TPA: hypothetical protein DCE41_04290 [Cytophagales bacterium]|nr:hypothetical protein [Cytophagales bacterium]HAA23446.1 hypothetical protein [Cytophagales bacterium]HAP62807.1 hypothetical protein [Cytophagales bacterium]